MFEDARQYQIALEYARRMKDIERLNPVISIERELHADVEDAQAGATHHERGIFQRYFGGKP